MLADMFVCSQDGKEVYKMPWLPEYFPKFSRSSKNETFETYDNGDYNNIGSMGLLEFSLEGKLPITPKYFSFSKNDVGAYKIINLYKKLYFKPLRLPGCIYLKPICSALLQFNISSISSSGLTSSNFGLISSKK